MMDFLAVLDGQWEAALDAIEVIRVKAFESAMIM
jgi:hypothetical protein